MRERLEQHWVRGKTTARRYVVDSVGRRLPNGTAVAGCSTVIQTDLDNIGLGSWYFFVDSER